MLWGEGPKGGARKERSGYNCPYALIAFVSSESFLECCSKYEQAFKVNLNLLTLLNLSVQVVF